MNNKEFSLTVLGVRSPKSVLILHQNQRISWAMLPPKVLGEKSFLASYRLSSSSSGRAWGTGGCLSVQSCSKCSLPSAQILQAERPVEAAASPAPVLAGFMRSASVKTPPQQVPGEDFCLLPSTRHHSDFSAMQWTTARFSATKSEPQSQGASG